MKKTKAKAKVKIGRPTKYTSETVDAVRTYLKECQDEYFDYHKTQSAKSDTYERKVKVKLPTMQGLALYLNINTDTVVEWGKIHPAFSVALKELLALQSERLIAGGLSGDYNPMITKLILSANHGMKERVDNTTDDQPLPAPVTVNNFKNLSDEELIALAQSGKSGAGQ